MGIISRGSMREIGTVDELRGKGDGRIEVFAPDAPVGWAHHLIGVTTLSHLDGRTLLSVDGTADDQQILHAALKTGPVHEFTLRRSVTDRSVPRGSSRMSNQLSGGRAIGLVARREFMTQISKKSFVISNVIILVAIIGGIIAFSLFSGGDEDKSKIGLVGNQSLSATMVSIGDTLGNPVTVTEVSDDGTARDQVKDGDLDVAVIAGSGGGVTVVTKKEVATNLRAVIESSVAQQAQSNALSAAGIDPAQLAEATSTAVVTIDAIDPPDPEQGQRIAMSIAAVVLLYMQILLFGTYVAMGVVEEKSSRVVELLLSTLRPLQVVVGQGSRNRCCRPDADGRLRCRGRRHRIGDGRPDRDGHRNRRSVRHSRVVHSRLPLLRRAVRRGRVHGLATGGRQRHPRCLSRCSSWQWSAWLSFR